MANPYLERYRQQQGGGGDDGSGNSYLTEYRKKRKKEEEERIANAPAEEARKRDEVAKRIIEDERKKKQEDSDLRRKLAEQTAKKRSLFEVAGDVFEANSPQDQKARLDQGKERLYQDQKKKETELFDKNKDTRSTNILEEAGDVILADTRQDKAKRKLTGQPELFQDQLKKKEETKAKEDQARFDLLFQEEIKKQPKDIEGAKKRASERLTKAEGESRGIVGQALDPFVGGAAKMIGSLPAAVGTMGSQALQDPGGTFKNLMGKAATATNVYSQGIDSYNFVMKALKKEGIDNPFKEGIEKPLAKVGDELDKKGINNAESIKKYGKELEAGSAQQAKDIQRSVDESRFSSQAREGENSVVTNLSSGASSLAVSVGLGYINPGLASAVIGLGSGADTVRKAREAGMSNEEALDLGAQNMIIQAAVEKVGLDKYLAGASSPVKSFVMRSFVEGAQETTQALIDSGYDSQFKDVDWMDAAAQAGIEGLYGMALGGGGDLVIEQANKLRGNLVEQGVDPAAADIIVDKQVEAITRNQEQEQTQEEAPVTPEEYQKALAENGLPADQSIPAQPQVAEEDVISQELDAEGVPQVGEAAPEVGVEQEIEQKLDAEGVPAVGEANVEQEIEQKLDEAKVPQPGQAEDIKKTEKSAEAAPAELEKAYAKAREQGIENPEQLSGDELGRIVDPSFEQADIPSRTIGGEISTMQDQRNGTGGYSQKQNIEPTVNIRVAGEKKFTKLTQDQVMDKIAELSSIPVNERSMTQATALSDYKKSLTRFEQETAPEPQQPRKKGAMKPITKKTEKEESSLSEDDIARKKDFERMADETISGDPYDHPDMYENPSQDMYKNLKKNADKKIEKKPAKKGAVKKITKKAKTDTKALAPLDEAIEKQYGKKAEKATPKQLAEAIGIYMPGNKLKAGIEVVQKLGRPRYGTDSSRPVLVFGGKLNGIFTDSYVAVVDPKVVGEIHNEIEKKEVKSYIKELQKDNRDGDATYAELEEQAKKYVQSQFEEYKDKFPKMQKGTDLSKQVRLEEVNGEKAEVVGYFADGMGSTTLFAAIQSKNTITAVNPDYLALFNKHFPNATYTLLPGDSLSPVQVVDKGKVVGVIMPIRADKTKVPQFMRSGAKKKPGYIDDPEFQATKFKTDVDAIQEQLNQMLGKNAPTVINHVSDFIINEKAHAYYINGMINFADETNARVIDHELSHHIVEMLATPQNRSDIYDLASGVSNKTAKAFSNWLQAWNFKGGNTEVKQGDIIRWADRQKLSKAELDTLLQVYKEIRKDSSKKPADLAKELEYYRGEMVAEALREYTLQVHGGVDRAVDLKGRAAQAFKAIIARLKLIFGKQSKLRKTFDGIIRDSKKNKTYRVPKDRWYNTYEEAVAGGMKYGLRRSDMQQDLFDYAEQQEVRDYKIERSRSGTLGLVLNTNTEKEYNRTYNLQDKDGAEYLTRILGAERVEQLKNGDYSHFRNETGGIEYWEDLAKVNIISEIPQTEAQKLNGKVAPYELKDRRIYHVSSSENTQAILKDGYKIGSELAEDAYRGGGYGVMQDSISFSTRAEGTDRFATGNRGVMFESELKPTAKVVTIKGIEDAVDLNDMIPELRKQGVDAVYIGGGENEIVVINPKAIKGTNRYKEFGVRTAKEDLVEFYQSNERQDTINAYQLARGEAAKTDKRAALAKTPEELAELADQLNKAGQKNAILRRGGLKSKKNAGVFQWFKATRKSDKGKDQGDEFVKLQDKVISDPKMYVTVLAHELSHAIEYNVMGNTKGTLKMFGDTTQAEKVTMFNELKAIVNNLEGEDVAKAKPSYYYMPTEMLARYVETLILEPSMAGELAPTVTEKFEIARIKHPMINELFEAIEGKIDAGFRNKTPGMFRDLRQTYQKYLGKRVGDAAYDAEIVRRAEVQRAVEQVGKLLKHKFKGVKDKPEALFRAVESVQVTRDGEPVFGTRDFQVAENDADVAKLEDAGYEFNRKMYKNGKEVAEFTRLRYTEEQGRAIFESLSPEGQQLVKDFTAAKEEARDEFNREFLKDRYKIEANIEGWVHRGLRAEEKGKMSLGRMGNRALKGKKAGMSKRRGVSDGYLEDFQKQMEAALVDAEVARIDNEFFKRQLSRISKPIARGAQPDEGWVEVTADLKSGIKLPGEGNTTLIGTDSGSVKVDKPRYQVPSVLAEHYRNIRKVVVEQDKVTKTLKIISKYWAINVLVHPGTMGTNAISGGIQYSAKILNDFYIDLLSGDLAMSKTRRNIAAPIQALLPGGWAKVPDYVFGGHKTNFAGQFEQQDIGNKTVEKYGDNALKLYGTIENYWKKVIALSEGMDLRTKEEAQGWLTDMDQATKEVIAAVNKDIDLYAFDYDNAPLWLQAWGNKGGAMVKPFMKYPYKYSKMVTNLASGGFDKTLPWEQRLAKVLTLTTMMAIAYGLMDDDEKETPEGSDKTPASFDPRGRALVGRGDDGREIFVRTAKYPFFNLTAAAMALLQKDKDTALDIFNDQVGTVAPLAKIGLTMAGYKDAYSQYKDKGQIVAESLASYIPGFRILKDVGNYMDPVARKPKGAMQAITSQFPIIGDEETKSKYRGERKNDEIPIEPPTRSISSKKNERSTYDKAPKVNQEDIMLSFLTGIYLKRIDPEDAKAFKLREERTLVVTEVRNLLSEGKEKEAKLKAASAGLTIPEGTYKYYERKRKKND